MRPGYADTTVPEALRALVQVQARARPLAPIATIRNRRVVYRLLAEDGTALAEFCDDHVTARATDGDGSATASSWREWEVELVQGPRTLLAQAEELILGAGAEAATVASKTGSRGRGAGIRLVHGCRARAVETRAGGGGDPGAPA